MARPQIDWVNAVRYETSNAFKERIPEATQENLKEIYATIAADQNLYAEFANALVKVARTIIHEADFDNHLEFMNKGDLDMGCAVEEMMADILSAHQYDPNDCNLCPKDRNNIEAYYQRQNRTDKYQVGILPEQMRCAFTERNGMERMLMAIANTLRNSAKYDEFIIKKKILGSVSVAEVNVSDISSVETAKSLVQAINTYIDKLRFPSRSYNKAGFMVETKKPDIIVVMRSDIMRQLDAILYSDTYNVNFSKIDAPVELVDDFGENADMICMVMNRDFIRVYDRLRTERQFENPNSLQLSMWLHIWQVYMASNFLEAVRIRKQVATTAVAADATELTLLPTQTHQVVITPTPSNASYTNMTWASADTTKVTVDTNGLITAVAKTTNPVNVTGTLIEDNTKTVTIAVTVS